MGFPNRCESCGNAGPSNATVPLPTSSITSAPLFPLLLLASVSDASAPLAPLLLLLLLRDCTCQVNGIQYIHKQLNAKTGGKVHQQKVIRQEPAEPNMHA
jgi:hypothetical protein